MLKELKITNIEPKKRLVFEEKSMTVFESNRIDAEYYQPKFKEMVKHLKQYSKDIKEFCKIVKIKDKNFKPKENILYDYIELSNVKDYGFIAEFMTNNGQNLPSRARRKVETGDLLISSIEGSLSSCALITKEFNGFLCSTGFYVVKSDKINSETLLVLLKSDFFQDFIKRGCTGTILTAINNNELSKVPIPDISIQIQTKIKDLIIRSYNLRKESKELLHQAIQKVENLIEKD